METREGLVTRAVGAAGLTVSGEKLRGYAVVYNSPTAQPVPVGRSLAIEVIDPHAFDQSLGGNITFTFNHASFAEYGDTRSGSLRLQADERGIAFELDLPAYASTLREAVDSAFISGMSFGFNPTVMEMRDGVRHIVKGELLHISPVYNPAYHGTSVELARRGRGLMSMRLRLAQI